MVVAKVASLFGTPKKFQGRYPEGIVPCRMVGWRQWEFYEAWEWRGIRIPEGTIVDGASVPRIPLARFVIGRADECFRATVLHDIRCERAVSYNDRKMADRAFYGDLRACRINPIRAFQIVFFVSLFALGQRLFTSRYQG